MRNASAPAGLIITVLQQRLAKGPENQELRKQLDEEKKASQKEAEAARRAAAQAAAKAKADHFMQRQKLRQQLGVRLTLMQRRLGSAMVSVVSVAPREDAVGQGERKPPQRSGADPGGCCVSAAALGDLVAAALLGVAVVCGAARGLKTLKAEVWPWRMNCAVHS
eukprot:Skav220584  [mRNA]  locus=scaffold145:302866:304347:- [translate_table: standard]